MNSRLWALAGCIGVIFFSSTSMAGGWCDRAFDYVWEFLLAELAPYAPPRSLMHLAAEKSVHLVLFCILGMLLWRTVPNRAGKIWLILVGGAIVGICSELLQSYFPRRDPMIKDVILNVAGTAMGILAGSAISRLQHCSWRRSGTH